MDRQLATAPILADPRWLHQVITNLLSNALKFTPSGGRVTISTRQEDTEAVLEVTDTGSGIPADELPASSSGSGAACRQSRSRQRHRPVRRGRPGPRTRRPANRGQPARARHDHDAHPAWCMTRGCPSQGAGPVVSPTRDGRWPRAAWRRLMGC